MRGYFPPIRSSRFPLALFGITLVGLLLASGVHVGFIVLLKRLELSDFVTVNIPILYWGLIAAGVTALILRLTKSTYEKPLQQLAQAARQVAGRDFSVYVPAIHSPDKQDYMDKMIRDFNKMVEELGSIETLKTDFFPMSLTRSRRLWPSSRILLSSCKACKARTCLRNKGRSTRAQF